MWHVSHAGKALVATAAMVALSGCEDGLDPDLRGLGGAFSTAPAAQNASPDRPQSDAMGVITYPNYQVAVARRGDTAGKVASRLGLNGERLATHNGIHVDAPLRQGELLALPERVQPPAERFPSEQPVDVAALAGRAIDASPAQPRATPTAATEPLPEPVQHQVRRGETAYTIARLYNVPVRTLAQWNGLGPQFDVREGQFLLIPPVPTAHGDSTELASAPGSGSVAPLPPSSSQPLPETPSVTAEAATPSSPPPDIGQQTVQSEPSALGFPVQGTIIREYAKGRNDGIAIKASPGSSVKAAAGGTVAAITQSADGVPIIVIRHPDQLLTVYANVTDVAVTKGDEVRRGQTIARLREGDQSFVHFEVRDGFDSVDPNNYLS